MAQAVKTIYRAFTTYTTTALSTGATLAAATEHTYAALTLQLPESSKTMRSVVLRIRFRDANVTTTRRFDGIRIGVQIDAVAFDDGTDLTGTGITATGDHWGAYADRDVTSYFTTNYTGTSHTVGARVRVETDVADTSPVGVTNITCELIVTYEYDDTSATQVKTVMIPHEGITGFLTTVANTDIRGSAGSGQIPALDTYLPETTKTYRQIYFVIEAADASTTTADIVALYSIDAGATATRATIEGGFTTSVRYFDIWNEEGFTKNAAHDFEAWCATASRFERFNVTMVVTYEFDASSSTTIMNSIIIPIRSVPGVLNSTAAGDQDVFEQSFWIEEPTTITIGQSALKLYYAAPNAGNLTVSVSGHDAAGGSQGTTNGTYTTTSLLHSGSYSLQHRIDLAHGGTAITLGRGKNTLRVKVFTPTAGGVSGFSGYFIINYTSGKSSLGLGAHNATTEWQLDTIYDGTIAGSSLREIATTNQKTPNIPQANYFLNGIGSFFEYNGSVTNSFLNISAEILSGEGVEDGWALIDVFTTITDAEFGHYSFIGTGRENWLHYPNDPGLDGGVMNLETARKQRLYGNATVQSSLKRVITVHCVYTDVTGTISGSAGGTVNIALLNATTYEVLKKTTRTGNGTFTIPWFDDTQDVIVLAWETDSLKGASKQAVAGTGFDIDLAGSAAATVGGRILIA